MELSLPDNDEIEVSIFGPGFGESILVHFGGGRWLIVDSCMNRSAQDAAALVYFREIGVSPSSAVELILASHWHDDHVAGIDLISAACANATFWCSDALRCPEFLALFELGFTRPDLRFTRGVSCMKRVVDGRGADIRFALSSMRIYQQKLTLGQHSVRVEVWALSPSQHEIYLAKRQLAELAMQPTEAQARIPARNPNHASVALLVIVGNKQLLLGADLEEVGDARLGWSAILASSTLPESSGTVFKVPHHASQTAHHDDVWSSMLKPNPIAGVTPYKLGSKLLPQPEDVNRVCKQTAEAYITKTRYSSRARRRANAVQKLLPNSLRRLASTPGHIRMRAKALSHENNWSVNVRNGAGVLRDFQFI